MPGGGKGAGKGERAKRRNLEQKDCAELTN